MKVTESVSERQSWSSAMRIEDIRTYGLNESVMASGLPFALPDSTGGQTEAHAFERASRLASTPIGTGHDNFLCGIIVQCTVTAPLYWWPQLQRYHHIDVVSSTSTMHTLSRVRDLAADTDPEHVELLFPYFSDKVHENTLIEFCSFCRECRDSGYSIDLLKANLPCGYLQTARITTNYRQLKTVYSQRRSHPLDEWQDFCRFIESLEASHLIVGVSP